MQVCINVLGWGVVGSAIAHVSRKVCLFILTYGYLWWFLQKEARDQAKDELWTAKVCLQILCFSHLAVGLLQLST